MSFDWSEYLKLAQELAGQTGNPASQEARLRAAVSRAYYAVFCISRACGTGLTKQYGMICHV